MRIRPYKQTDAAFLFNWLQDEKTVEFWKADRFSYPLTQSQLDRYADDYEEDLYACQFTALDGSAVPVGHFSFRNISFEKETAHMGFIITDPSVRGMGYGKQMVDLALTCAFSLMDLKQVTLGVYDCNFPAVKCYHSLGFRYMDIPPLHREYHGEMWTYRYMKAVKPMKRAVSNERSETI